MERASFLAGTAPSAADDAGVADARAESRSGPMASVLAERSTDESEVVEVSDWDQSRFDCRCLSISVQGCASTCSIV